MIHGTSVTPPVSYYSKGDGWMSPPPAEPSQLQNFLLPAVFGCVMIVATISAVIGMVLPDWTHGKVTFASTPPITDDRTVGLWWLCGTVSPADMKYTSDCEGILDFVDSNCDDNKDDYRFLQAFAIITCICFFFATCIVPAGFMLKYVWVTMGGALLTVLGVCTGLVVIIAWITQIAEDDWPCMNPANRSVVPNGDIGPGWVIFLIAVVLAICALLLACYFVWDVLQRRNVNYMRYPSPQQQQQQQHMMAMAPTYNRGTPVQPQHSPTLMIPVAQQSPHAPPPVPMYAQQPQSPVSNYQPWATSPVLPPPQQQVVMMTNPAMSGGLGDPLLARVEQVKENLAHTLAQDVERTIAHRSLSPLRSPHSGTYIPSPLHY